MAGKEAVSINDRRKAKTTCKVLAVFGAFFLAASALLVAFTPRSSVVKGIDNSEKEPMKSMNDCNYGATFAVTSAKTIQRYTTVGKKLIQTLPYASEIISMCEEDGNPLETNTTAFNDITCNYINEDGGYELLIDADGDIFRLDDSLNADGNYQFTLKDDYWLTERGTFEGSFYKAKYILRGITVKDGILYTLSKNESKFVGMKFDVNNLKAGPIARKTLYTMTAPDKDQKITYGSDVYIIDPIDSEKGENPYSIGVADDCFYVFTSYGLNRWSLDFKDYEYVNDKNETVSVSYLGDGVSYFISELRKNLLSMNDSEKASHGLSDDIINDSSDFMIRQIYQAIYGDSGYVSAEMAAAASFRSQNEWIKNYDPTVRSESLVIRKSYADPHYNLAVKVNGDQTVGGIAFAEKAKTIYYLDVKDTHLYKTVLNGLDDFLLNDDRDLTSVSTDTGISYSGYSFSSIKNNIGYDYNANALHVYFYSSRKISSIDLNGEKPAKKFTFDLEYDIRYFFETQDGSRVGAYYQTEKRTLNNVASFPLHAAIVNPETYQYKNTFTVLFIISVVLCVASLIAFAVALRAYHRTMTLLRMKVIGRDFRRHKFTYLALLPYVILLIMFCWIEAVGSISFSFFNYTMQKPSYIWNSFGNYIEIFNDSSFWLMLGNTAFFLIFDLFLGIVPPIIFAFFLSIIKNKKLSGVLRSLMFIPAIVPGIASLLIWKVGIFGDSGVLNQIICLFKYGATSSSAYTPINFLHDTDISRWSLLLMGFPYVGGYLIFYGGIMNIPKEYDEACQLEGVGVVKRFITVDLPLIKPQIKYILVMGILSSVQNYERTYMLGSSGTTTLVESMYRQMKDVANPNYGLASAYATVIFLLLLLPVLWNFRNTKKNTMGDAL